MKVEKLLETTDKLGNVLADVERVYPDGKVPPHVAELLGKMLEATKALNAELEAFLPIKQLGGPETT